MMTNINANGAAALNGDLINKAWTDEAFRAQLIANPRETLESHGARIPEGVDVEVVADAPSKLHIVLPAAPEEGEISDSDLVEANGGATVSLIVVSMVSLLTHTV